MLVGIVETRPDQLRHAAIGDDEALVAVALHTGDPVHEHRVIADYGPAGLDDEHRAPAQEVADRIDQVPLARGFPPRCARSRSPRPAADIEVAKVEALVPDGLHEPDHQLGGVAKDPDLLDGRSKVAVDADQVEAPVAADPAQKPGEAFVADAELGVLYARGNVGMDLGVHVRVDADEQIGPSVESCGGALYVVQVELAVDC